MDPVHRLGRPSLRSPRAVMAFEGWSDAADAASGAAAFLLGQFEAEPFAVLEPEDFYDLHEHRPRVVIDEGGTRQLTWPDTRFAALHLDGQAHDLVVVTAEEPNLRWKTYTRLVAGVLAESDVELVITLGSFIGQVAHTRPVPLIGIATDPALLADHGLTPSSYQGPTGIIAVMHEACREVGIPAIGLWAATPHYLAANPSPKAMLALMEKAAGIAGVAVDTTELATAASEFDARVNTAVERNAEFADYIRQLEDESAVTPVDPSLAGTLLVSEIEDFLRDRD